MLSSQTLDRLGALNREPLTAISLPSIGKPHFAVGESAADTAQDAMAFERGEEIETAWGPCWRIDVPLDRLWPNGRQRLPAAEAALQGRVDDESIHAELRALARGLPQGALYLDLETCGLAGAMAFLVGLLHHDGDTWKLTQFLARDYSEEKAMLQSLWNIARDKSVLVTFNGKCFDWPLVHDRSTRHLLGRRRVASKVLGAGTAPRDTAPKQTLPPFEESSTASILERRDWRPELVHCDVLHHARRRWRSRLPNCKLQTLEWHLCGRRRVADIAGRDIPAAYHQYVRTKDAWPMRSILHHNALDLVTLLEVSLRVAGPPITS